MSLQLVRIEDELPEGFDSLRRAADAEGERNLTRLAQEWAEHREDFTCLLAAFRDGEIIAIGGLTPEPAAHPGEAWRMRRLYVRADARRQGVGSALAHALLSEALTLTRLVTVHAGAPAAAKFWEALGFERRADRGWSHQFLTV